MRKSSLNANVVDPSGSTKKSADRVRRYLKPNDKTVKSEIVQAKKPVAAKQKVIRISRQLILPDIVKMGKFDHLSDRLQDLLQVAAPASCIGKWECDILRLEEVKTSNECIVLSRQDGWLPAQFGQLLVFAAYYPELTFDGRLAAMGTLLEIDRRKYVPILRNCYHSRHLSASEWWQNWQKSDSLLRVRQIKD